MAWLEFAKNNYQEGVDFLGKGGGSSPRWGMISAVIVVVIIAYIAYEKHKGEEEEKEEEECLYECYPSYGL